ncbi:MAG: N-acetylmuramic acid 6-phosphate etherase [bacterium]
MIPPTPPPNRAQIDTEQRNPRSHTLHTLNPADCLALLATEDFAALNAVRSAHPQIEAFIRAVEPHFCTPHHQGRLIYIGAGTSGRLGVLDASEAPPTFCVPPGKIIALIAGGDSALRTSSEGKEDDPSGCEPELTHLHLTAHDAVLAIAAGGTTPYALGSLPIAKRLAPHCTTALLTCARVPNPPSCDHLITLATGPEVLTGSTRMKAGTATKLTLNAISTTLMVRAGRVYQNLMVDVKASNDKLRDRAARVIATLTGLDRNASLKLLDQADGNAKTAIVINRKRVTREQAEHLIKTLGPSLANILDPS